MGVPHPSGRFRTRLVAAGNAIRFLSALVIAYFIRLNFFSPRSNQNKWFFGITVIDFFLLLFVIPSNLVFHFK